MNDYSYTDSNNRWSLKNLFKRLEEALHYIKILGKIVPNSNIFMSNIFIDVKINFDILIEKFE